MSLLGLDLGTSACKAATFDIGGKLFATATREYSGYAPRPGWLEMDPEIMWRAAAGAIREAAAKTDDPVQALAVSSQGETFIPVDAQGQAIGPAIMNADNRAVEEVREFERNIGKQEVYSITGCVLHPMYGLLKILWLKKNAPDVYDRASRFFSAGDYALARMEVEPYTDYSLASRLMAFDVTKREWSDSILSLAGVSADRLPEVRPSGTRAGVLSATVAGGLGLLEGTVVAVGGHDQPCGALGAGVIDAGDTADSAGTYECLAVVSDTPNLGADALSFSLNSYCHVVPDRYVTLAFFPAGIVLRWFRDEFGQSEVEEAKRTGMDAYDLLTSRAPDGPSGILFTPHFIGSGNPTWNARATGAVVGLTPDRSKYHLLKAILEGIACEIRTNVAVFEETVGPVDLLRTTGGGAKSAYWLQLRADITGRKVAAMGSPEAVCLGAAILAGVGAGAYPDARYGARTAAAVATVYEPNAGRTAEYADQIRRYQRLYPVLADCEVY